MKGVEAKGVYGQWESEVLERVERVYGLHREAVILWYTVEFSCKGGSVYMQ